VQAKAGIETVLLDVSQESAEKGKAYSQRIVDKDVSRGKITMEKGDELLAKITPSTDYSLIKGADLVVEAVFENVALKADVTKKAEEFLGENAVFGSNTSTLPITGLAEASARPKNFIGIHFFSPVEKMPLVEIILGKETEPAAIAKALDFVSQIKKTPIVVNDSRGFYTSRCFGTYVQEGVEMVAEGINPALIENAGRQLGMPVGPLAVGDEVSIELGHKIVVAAQKELGDAYVAQPSDAVMARMVELGRLGRKNAKGWYDYPEGGKKHLWPGLEEMFPRAAVQPDVEEVKERLLYRQLVECARCFEEGVLETPEDGDIGAIFGWGFAPWTGGPFSHMDTAGIGHVVAVLERLAARHGDRFAPTVQLQDMAASGATFYHPASSRAAA
jgi:3-hydroxyacyl-CoA dehydrogenase/enoyl-CoA hydratase/3-hydroxybutyryl-CoA epimerase